MVPRVTQINVHFVSLSERYRLRKTISLAEAVIERVEMLAERKSLFLTCEKTCHFRTKMDPHLYRDNLCFTRRNPLDYGLSTVS